MVDQTVVGGTCSDRFASLRELFAEKLASGEDLGASLAVILDGEPVVDLWGGWTDEARTVPWGEHTITNVFSTTKTMTALAALVLVDRGELDLDAAVASYWPEFAAQGKEGVTVRHLLSHRSGVSGWERPITIEDLYDWNKSTARLAAQAPWWPPGTASGYHPLTYGHLIGEVIRRITGRQLGEFFAREIAKPVGADFHIGLPPAEFPRVANVVPPPALTWDESQLDPESLLYKTVCGPTNRFENSWTASWRRADIGAANGHGNARSVARIQSAVAGGGVVGGVRLLSPATIDRIFEAQSDGIDLVLGIRLRIGLGYGLPWPEVLPFVPHGRVCFGSGAGGSLVIADADRRLTIAYVMNKIATYPNLVVGPIAAALAERVYEIVGRSATDCGRRTAPTRERRIVIYGNAGSGKTTMARRLGLPMLSLDDVAWSALGVRAPLAESLAALKQFMAAEPEWVIEGCYGDLIEAAAANCTELRFLHPGAAVCAANARNRPWTPGYCESPEQQAELLGPLLEFIRAYEQMEGECGLKRHQAIFAGHAGPKHEYTVMEPEPPAASEAAGGRGTPEQ